MTSFEHISARVERIKDADLNLKKVKEYDDLPFYDDVNRLSYTENRKVIDNLSTLLIIYGKNGTECSISTMGKRTVQRECPRLGWFHKHEYVEVLYVIEGSFTQVLLGEEIRFEQGEFVITDQNCEHADYIDVENSAVLFLCIQADYLERLLRSYNGTDKMQQFLFHALWSQKREQSFLEFKNREVTNEDNGKNDFDMGHLLELLVSEDLAREPGYEQMEEGLMIRLLRHLCEDYTLQLHTDSKESKEKAFLYELERYIRTNFASVTTEELEKIFHYHRNYYNLILKKYRGKSFRQYVIDVRMKYARQLLEQTTFPIKQVAQQVGYENISHFYHLFKECFGKSPKEVRGVSK